MGVELIQQKHMKSMSKTSKPRGRSKANNNNKFVGVRQRPSGRWVAEIKDTTQKIRMWLGTFETAEEAAKAYDEAACLLRGSNTRTNFVTHVSLDSPLASRIRNLLNNKKSGKKQLMKHEQPVEIPTPSNSTLTISTSTSSSTSSSNTTSYTDNSTPSSEVINDNTQVFDDVYKPDMSNCREELEFGKPDMSSYRKELEFGSYQHGLSWDFAAPGFDRFSFTQEVLDFPRNMELPETNGKEFTEFDRMKVERQISASLYAINGVQEYMETVHDSMEALWDLPPIY